MPALISIQQAVSDASLEIGITQRPVDRVLFDARLAVAGIKYRFLQAKGLEFGEQMRDFTVRMTKIAARANNRVLDLNDDESRAI